MECSIVILHNKLTNLALPVAILEAFWGRWWPLSELLEIRASLRAPVCGTVTGLVVGPGFSVRFTVMEELISHVIPPFIPPPSSLPSVLPSVFHPQTSSVCPLMNPTVDLLCANHWARYSKQWWAKQVSSSQEAYSPAGEKAKWTVISSVIREIHPGQGSLS